METKFKLVNSKPSQDFIEWNELMSSNFDQDYYYERSNPFIVWVEKIRIITIIDLIKKYILLKNLSNPVIAEVGCGEGHVLKEIANKIQTKNLMGVDPLDGWLEKAKRKLNGSAKLLKGLTEDLPFESNFIDITICTEVLEHVIDPTVALKELWRVMKQDGLLIISIPNELLVNKLKNIIHSLKIYDLLFQKIQKHNDWHIHSFDLTSFKKLIPGELKINSISEIPLTSLPLRYVITFRK